MALLQLKDIGKIYVSEGNVAVGIRGVNLSFDRGEFVAVTGRSGSGKSTLLNVISGMDSYEEGELYIEGQSTSHYLQSDWETYREKYISFIFQDYNIIESYTVLQNVELALMHIADHRERRRRAVELLTRVGMREHLHHKGSKLSGGQKQRTVIARALAKDSPIILADEPTGNLDHATSMEIIELLREVSKDKLLIVVTHNFEEVEACATRHVRIFDGAVESDQQLVPTAPEAAARPVETDGKKPGACRRAFKQFGDSLALGTSVFTARPKLSFFLCFLLIIGTLGIFLITSLMGEELNNLFAKNYMFTPMDGRVIITHRDGAIVTEEEIKDIREKTNATDALRYDYLLDEGEEWVWFDAIEDSVDFAYTYHRDFGTPQIGRYPTVENEVFLYLPIYLQPVFGSTETGIIKTTFTPRKQTYTVVGISYYYDNNQSAQILLTEEGFRTATAAYFLGGRSGYENFELQITLESGEALSTYMSVYPSATLENGKIYIGSQKDIEVLAQELTGIKDAVKVKEITAQYTSQYNEWKGGYSLSRTFSKHFSQSDFTYTEPTDYVVRESEGWYWYYDYDKGYETAAYVAVDLYRTIVEETLNGTYRQSSLFYGSSSDVKKAIEYLNENGYIAALSDTEYEPDPLEMIVNTLQAILYGLLWLLSILFLAFFINLCSDRTLSAFKGDMAIMRSMGISVKTIRFGMYARTFIALIPAYIVMAGLAIYLYTSPALNRMFTYLYAWQYAVIVIGMLLLTARVTKRQSKKLFGESVKKSLRGGDNV